MAGWCFFASSQRRGEENDLISLLFSFNTLIFSLFFCLLVRVGRPGLAVALVCLQETRGAKGPEMAVAALMFHALLC